MNVSILLMSHPISTGKYVSNRNTSNVEFEGVLPQIQDGSKNVTGYFSKVLSKPDYNNCMTRRKATLC